MKSTKHKQGCVPLFLALLGALLMVCSGLVAFHAGAQAEDVPSTSASSSAIPDLTPTVLIAPSVPTVRQILTPSTEIGGMPVIYAGAGDGSWPDQMEPNDGPDDLFGPAPVDVGTLYRSLNLLTRTDPAPNPLRGEDRDWYVWHISGGRCYRAFTGDITGQLSGKGKVQHGIRLWWYSPVKEGRKVLAEYNPGMGPAEGGYFAAVTACAEIDGQMAAEVFNYAYPLKAPRGATYTFGVLDVGIPVVGQTNPLGSDGSYTTSPVYNGAGPGTARASTNTAPLSSQLPTSTPLPATPTTLPPPPTATPTATLYTTTTAVPFGTATATPLLPMTITPTMSPTPLSASVDVVAYLDQNQNGAPDPGEGLRDLRVALLDVRTNSVQKTASTNSDGYARIEWSWSGPVRIALPDLNWSDLVDPYDMVSASRPHSDVWSTAEDGSLYLEVRVLPAKLPAVIP